MDSQFRLGFRPWAAPGLHSRWRSNLTGDLPCEGYIGQEKTVLTGQRPKCIYREHGGRSWFCQAEADAYEAVKANVRRSAKRRRENWNLSPASIDMEF